MNVSKTKKAVYLCYFYTLTTSKMEMEFFGYFDGRKVISRNFGCHVRHIFYPFFHSFSQNHHKFFLTSDPLFKLYIEPKIANKPKKKYWHVNYYALLITVTYDIIHVVRDIM